ncbi:hypothetical protein PI23P_09155 [Polaribacter irgensii 23-P]|jgi:hypothetical protein|uniref:Uncharacterized protein n=1 Tax=Polaribacter irgensii 23-P TaxID=313594 RepID=A4C040_9FLAO|nr:hypothetical protein [Polaribacter irgensii]EAR12783.1 hypothetical protein PI23P_09155 [Polaribacter irgensii 23-P]
MARAMFDYTITVLKKVSFNSELFCKELKKGLENLLPNEVDELSVWLYSFVENKPDLFVCMALLE